MQKKSGDIDKKLWQNWSHSGKISDFFREEFQLFLKNSEEWIPVFYFNPIYFITIWPNFNHK